MHEITDPTDSKAPAAPTIYASHHFKKLYDYSEKEYLRWTRKFRYEYDTVLPKNPNARILDLGCGGGRFLYYLKSRGYRNLVGVDGDHTQLFALQKIVDCEIHQADALGFLASHEKEFDLIACHHLIEHLSLSDSLSLLRLARRALLPGGRLLLATPNGSRPWVGWHMFADLSHDHLYTSSSLSEVLEIAGYRNVKIRPESAVPWDLLGTTRWLLWKLWREPYLKFTFALDNGLGCLGGSPLIVSEGLIAIADQQSDPEDHPGT